MLHFVAQCKIFLRKIFRFLPKLSIDAFKTKILKFIWFHIKIPCNILIIFRVIDNAADLIL